MLRDFPQHRVNRRFVESFLPVQHDGLIEVMRVRPLLLEKPALDRSQLNLSGYLALVNRARNRPDMRAKLRNGRIFEQVPDFQLVAGLMQPSGNLNRLNGIAA
ncbi:hypothetical protein YDYSG_05070 [Paenibacillus tyrfis]|nr:hypothetical protein YDYSG_05070 [Paenibacillus tyrfis]